MVGYQLQLAACSLLSKAHRGSSVSKQQSYLLLLLLLLLLPLLVFRLISRRRL